MVAVFLRDARGRSGSGIVFPTRALPASGMNMSQSKSYAAPPAFSIDLSKSYTAVIETEAGTMKAELYADDAPTTVNNFVFLSRDGYYSDVIFHRVIDGFMIQGGDPTGTGRGGPGYRFQDEPVKRKYLRGTLAMANAGPNTNGSQFFITTVVTEWLDKAHVVFGKVVEGMDVVKTIEGLGSRNGRTSKDIRVADCGQL